MAARIGSCMILPAKERISCCISTQPISIPAIDDHHGHDHGRRRRRSGLLLISTLLLATSSKAKAADTNNDQAQLLQKYLKKSEENKAKNDKERLDKYYKRNYKDYFDFVEGSVKGKTRDQLSESEKAILDWLEANK
ncbi:uncharacterized protein LOC124927551 [Impatiens glandulifera]|uniref:uncharacterized protein LOC124927551 n=1 Tax=Impatiens glandulifera TaxID=253017 RepID=UPI001FB0F39F|nr:uncharacterized protein LOC124927551 [Impatiens glandulifera]